MNTETFQITTSNHDLLENEVLAEVTQHLQTLGLNCRVVGMGWNEVEERPEFHLELTGVSDAHWAETAEYLVGCYEV